MYIVVGLGNPEEDYSRTRHNMGFNVINEIAKEYDVLLNKKKFGAIYGEILLSSEKVIFVKPQTYMNLSGTSVKQFVDFYKVPMKNLIIIYDDMDIEKGSIKIRKKGGPGNHNGMKSVEKEISSDTFPRIRVGIGTPEFKNDIINYVLGHIPEEEYKILQNGIKEATSATIDIIKNGIDYAMNKYN